jgi:hypothetical protein
MLGVIAHFGDIHAAILIEGEGDWGNDVGFAGGEFGFETFANDEGFCGVGRFDGREAREVFGIDFGFSGGDAYAREGEKENEAQRHEGVYRFNRR